MPEKEDKEEKRQKKKKQNLSLKKAKEKLEECKKQKEEYLKGWQRERADFINYKKEERERIEELIKYSGNGFLMKFLPVLDDFNVAEKQIPDDLRKEEHVKGLLQIKKQLETIFNQEGIKEIDCVGKKFNPHFHEAIEMIEESELEEENKGKIESGTVIEEIQKGYVKDGRVLRPSKVKVLK